jgi:hypothetical protein
MVRTLRRVVISVAVAIGLVAITAAPALAGLSPRNHSEPLEVIL